MGDRICEIVKYRPEYYEGILKLQRERWGADAEVNASFFEWKYKRNPYIQDVLIYLAVCGSEVVGMRGIYGSKWQMDGNEDGFVWPCASGLMIHPDYRNRGLFAKLNEAALMDLSGLGFDYVFNFSASEVNFLASLVTGWRSIGLIPAPRYRRSRHTIFYRGLRKIASRVSVVTAFQLRFRKRVETAEKKPTAEVNPFERLDRHYIENESAVTSPIWASRQVMPDRMADFIERLGFDGRIRHVKDREFFSWRYANPLCRYRFFYAGQDPLHGYLVLQSLKGNPGRVHIVDWQAHEPATQVMLLETAQQWGQFENLRIWTGSLSAKSKEILINFGFYVPKPRRFSDASLPTVLIKPTYSSGSGPPCDWSWRGKPLLDLTNWNLSMIDSDSY